MSFIAPSSLPVLRARVTRVPVTFKRRNAPLGKQNFTFEAFGRAVVMAPGCMTETAKNRRYKAIAVAQVCLKCSRAKGPEVCRATLVSFGSGVLRRVANRHVDPLRSDQDRRRGHRPLCADAAEAKAALSESEALRWQLVRREEMRAIADWLGHGADRAFARGAN